MVEKVVEADCRTPARRIPDDDQTREVHARRAQRPWESVLDRGARSQYGAPTVVTSCSFDRERRAFYRPHRGVRSPYGRSNNSKRKLPS
jgi:hypothetical protein